MSTEPMHSLAFALRKADDLFALSKGGRDKPSAVTKKDWDALWNVVDRATNQVEATLDAVTCALADGLQRTGLRFERVTRAETSRTKWEAFGRVFPGRSRTAIGLLGGSIGIDAARPTMLSIWWGYLKARGIRGPHFAEVLRTSGSERVRLGIARDGWVAGTVVLAELDLSVPRSVVACSELAREAAVLLVANRDALLKL